MVKFTKLPLLAGVVAWLALMTNMASASPLVPTLTSISAAGPPFTWTYNVTFTVPAERIDTGDFFVIYDFAGFAGVGAIPAGWTATLPPPLLGPNPLGSIPPLKTDDPTIPNVVFTRTGATIVGGTGNLGDFQILSAFNNSVQGAFSAETTKEGGPQDGTPIVTLGFADVPVAIPEPGTLLLVAAGPLFVVFAVKRGLRRRAVPA